MKALAPEELLGPLNDIEMKYAPKTLYVEGDISLLKKSPRIAVIGTRHPSELGKKRTAKLTKALVQNSCIIISGLAEGVDTIAHLTAIESGGRTIAVLGTPLDRFFPAKNKMLQHTIMEKHLAVSQFPSNYPIQPKNFPMRNRIMALIADASVIIEASDKSGTLSQGWETLRLGRALYIMKSVCEDNSLNWPRKMIDYGAIPLFDTESLIYDLPLVRDDVTLNVAI
ncbi:MAG: DNA-protecting protein DprA [Candidatus Aminicenantes bacterium]|nr:DNA-protecting protein DprA [Candidatus Aminicenantes bacterium]